MKQPTIHPAFESSLQRFQETLRGLRSGRASTGLVESLSVDAYGTLSRLRDIASISTPDARTVQIEPWDRSLVPAIEKAITISSLGIQPTTAGTVIRLSLPPLTEERRKELVKLVGKHLEESRIGIRTAREKLLRDLKRQEEEEGLSENESGRQKKQLQEQVDAALTAAQTLADEKEQELLST